MPFIYERTHHIMKALSIIRNKVCKKVFKMSKIHNDENPTNMLTKVIPVAKFKVEKCGLKH